MKNNNLNDTLHRMKRGRMLYLMILPGIAAMFIFHYIPIYGLQIAFKDFSNKLGIWGSPWVGFKHFERFFNYPYFWQIIRNTIWISVRSLMNFPFPIIFALMLNEMKNKKLKNVCQMITYAPHFVSVIVCCSIVRIFTQREGGLINILLGIFGVAPIDFMGQASMFADIYAISSLWQDLGWGTILYMSALSGVSQELVEAAQIDGANRMSIIRNVYLPHLKPTIVVVFILNLGQVLSVGFEKAYALQTPLNLDASNIIATYVYETGIVSSSFSYSTAIGLFNSVVNILIVCLANAISKKVTQTSLW